MNLRKAREIVSPFFISVGLGIPGGLLSSRARFRFLRQFGVITFAKKLIDIFALLQLSCCLKRLQRCLPVAVPSAVGPLEL